MVKPVYHSVVTSPYGWRVLNGERQFHDGIDFVCDKHVNQSVRAITAGVVTYDFDNYQEALRWVKSEHSIGNAVIIEHTIGGKYYFVRYCHLVKNYVTAGESVTEGQIIGAYGDVGYSFGPHLHIDAYDDGWKKVDITKLLEA